VVNQIGLVNSKYQFAVIADEEVLDYNVGFLNGPFMIDWFYHQT